MSLEDPPDRFRLTSLFRASGSAPRRRRADSGAEQVDAVRVVGERRLAVGGNRVNGVR